MLYTRIEAAKYLRLSVPQLDNLARRGEISRVKMGQGPRARVVYRQQDLDVFVDAHVVLATEDEKEDKLAIS